MYAYYIMLAIALSTIIILPRTINIVKEFRNQKQENIMTLIGLIIHLTVILYSAWVVGITLLVIGFVNQISIIGAILWFTYKLKNDDPEPPEMFYDFTKIPPEMGGLKQ